MNTGMNLALWGSGLLILPILYFIMANETKFKKNIVIGVTLPYAAREDAEIAARLKRFKRELGCTCLLLLLLVLPGLFVKNFGWSMFVWGLWLLLAMVLPQLSYIRCNRDLKILKEQKGWKRTGEPLRIDTAAIEEGRWLSPWCFAPAFVLSLLPLLWDWEMFEAYIIMSIFVLGCWAGYRWLYRNRSETVDENADLARTLSRIRKRSWGRVWLLCAWFMAGMNVSMSLLWDKPALSLGLVIVLSVLLIAEAMRTEFRLRHIQEKLTAQSGQGWYVDEDDKWIWGQFYYNPQDSRSIVNARVGVNSTVNLATSFGKFMMILTAALMLALPFLGFIVDGAGGKPITMEVENRSLTVCHGAATYEVDSIDRVELLYELPDGLIRIQGTGVDSLLKGDFRAKELGHVTVCLDPRCPPFLLVESDGEICLFGSRDADLTASTYEKLK